MLSTTSGNLAHVAFDRAIQTLNQKQYQDALTQTLIQMKDLESSGEPSFPVIKMLSESESERTVELDGCGFDNVCLWAEKKLGHFLEATEREELMTMFVQFHDRLMKEINTGV